MGNKHASGRRASRSESEPSATPEISDHPGETLTAQPEPEGKAETMPGYCSTHIYRCNDMSALPDVVRLDKLAISIKASYGTISVVPDLAGHTCLTELLISHNRLTTVGSLPVSLTRLDLSYVSSLIIELDSSATAEAHLIHLKSQE